jgi:pimeloyl-ACP methyl ester carboxylesterase
MGGRLQLEQGDPLGRSRRQPAAFAPRADTEEQTVLRAVQRPLSLACITTPVGHPLWKDRPSWYLVGEDDRVIPPVNQHFMAERMGATVRAHDVDHMPLVTAPGAVVDMLLEAVGSVKPEGLQV